jgi:hypothetical protein
MRHVHSSLVALAIAAASPALLLAQAQAGDASRTVAGGGISVAGWQGKADAGAPISDAKLTKEADAFHVVTGPAIGYWNPANVATGNYTVKATFKEPHYMNLNDHNHPYGILIGGNDMGTDNQTYLYCAAYGNGTYIVRGFGPAPFSVSPRRATADSAVNKAAAKDAPVTQEIAVSVKGDKVECAINGKTVASYNKADVVGPGKLKSTDGVYGFRFAHNTEGFVTGLTMIKQ